jgi:hypothetical protein
VRNNVMPRFLSSGEQWRHSSINDEKNSLGILVLAVENVALVSAKIILDS